MKKFSELPPEKREVWAEKVKISEVIGHEITITGFDIIPSKYGQGQEATRIHFQRGDTKHICYTSSALLRRQLESTEDELPFTATIVDKNHWLSLS